MQFDFSLNFQALKMPQNGKIAFFGDFHVKKEEMFLSNGDLFSWRNPHLFQAAWSNFKKGRGNFPLQFSPYLTPQFLISESHSDLCFGMLSYERDVGVASRRLRSPAIKC